MGLAVPHSGGRTITVAGERFHMVQNVSMAVHHIGREPTVRGQGPRWGGEQRIALIEWASPYCVSPIAVSLPLCLLEPQSLPFLRICHFSVSVCPSPSLALALPY